MSNSDKPLSLIPWDDYRKIIRDSMFPASYPHGIDKEIAVVREWKLDKILRACLLALAVEEGRVEIRSV